MVDVFRKRKFELLAFTEIKLKGEVLCCRVNGIFVGVEKKEIQRVTKFAACLMKDEWHSVFIDFKRVSSRNLS